MALKLSLTAEALRLTGQASATLVILPPPVEDDFLLVTEDGEPLFTEDGLALATENAHAG